MHKTRLQVESPKGHQTVHVKHGQDGSALADLLRQANLPLNTRCGERGLCDGCVVELISGQAIHNTSGQLAVGNGQPVMIRGCEYRPAPGQTLRLRIPPRSLVAYEPQVVTEFRINVPYAHDPLWQRMQIPWPAVAADQEPAEAVCAAVAERSEAGRIVAIEPRARQQLAAMAPADSLWITLEQRGDRWLITDVAAQDGIAALGAAIDIGTTTVAILLVDLLSGKVVGQSADFNQQMHLGDDVLTRINLCTTNPAMLSHLQDAVVGKTIRPLLDEALRQASAPPERIACLTMAGNTTMLHLLAGVDPSSMGVAPFTPTFLEHRVMPPGEVRLTLGDGPATRIPTIHLLPGAAAYVGADLCAGVLASGLAYDDGPSLLVDVGTNGEIIFKQQDRLLGCATAAGPAFEGAGLSCGMRAGDGVIDHVRFSVNPFAVEIGMIHGEKVSHPVGLCGSAYVDLLAQGRRLGLLTTTGRFDLSAVPDAAEHMITAPDGSRALRLAFGQGKRPIMVSETDIARLLQAKAAIAAGILTLLEREGIAPQQLKTLYLAGGFGMHLDLESAFGCGLLPGFSRQQVQLVGNTSLAGAFLALLDSSVLDELGRIGKRMEIVELNLDPGFEMRFIDQLSLPE